MKLNLIAAGTWLAACIASAQAAPLIIQDAYVRSGVSDMAGTLGSNGSTTPGILFDPTGTGNYGNNDFLTPGTPFEGFYFTADQGQWASNNDGNVTAIVSPFALTQNSPTMATATSTTSDGRFRIVHTYTVARIGTRSEIQITTTLTNTSAAPITGLKALRVLDPDPDVNTYSSYETINTVQSPTRVCGTGTLTQQTICLYAPSPSYPVGVGISDYSWSTNPDDYLGGMNFGNGDNVIGLAFNIGTVAPAASAVLRYRYILSDTIENSAPSETAVPVPVGGLGSVLFTVIGIVGMAGYLTRRKAVG